MVQEPVPEKFCIENKHWNRYRKKLVQKIYLKYWYWYDAVSDVVESGVQSRSNFKIGSRVFVISCIEVDEITQTLKIADFTM